MELFGFHRNGFDGFPVAVEVDVRPGGLPGIDLVGLPDNAVREAKERVRSGLRNSGFSIPKGRILLNLAPAGIRKEGAGFDLPIALALAGASHGWFRDKEKKPLRVMAIGEVQLSGAVKGVRGILSAAAAAVENSIDCLLVPKENADEAASLGAGQVLGVSNLRQCILEVGRMRSGRAPEYLSGSSQNAETDSDYYNGYPDYADVKGQKFLKRGMEIAAAGGHHSLIFGVPGTGKTMSALRLGSILPPLSRSEAVEVTKLYSIAGKLQANQYLLTHPRVRSPHHSSSLQGMLGGGKGLIPGEISLAHRGVLILDEAPEFSKHVLQNLREPLERGEVHIARAGKSAWFPARFQLVMTANPCPCGNLGRKKGICICSQDEIGRYWKKIGGALLDRIDIRIPVSAESAEVLDETPEETSSEIKDRVCRSMDFRVNVRRQKVKNADLTAGQIESAVELSRECRSLLALGCEKLDLSSRAVHSILRVVRTIADLACKKEIHIDHLKEAILYRRYGDANVMWTEL